ncbi:ferritin-like domain-containing protein [Novosphingobium aerophilum]|uniref:ferritin-like domain-containing protein n=1 Tax=Novosphingobium aerophilum TaxID=2839843 RepID=UPI003FD659A9
MFAAYSLGGPQVPAEHHDKVARWQAVLLGIAREEMGHLVTVQNLLKLLGGPINLERDDFPWDTPFYPFPFSLEPVSLGSLARYVCIESPETWPDPWAKRRAEIEGIGFPGGASDFKRVGLLYETLKNLVGDKTLIPDDLFHADTLSFQASFAEWGRGYAAGARGATEPGARVPDVLIHTAYSRSTALDALEAVAEQGEASHADGDKDPAPSHFERFMGLFLEIEAVTGWTPWRPVAANPRAVGDPDAVPGTTYIGNPVARVWARLLNLRYRMLLSYIAHSFRISGDYTSADGLTRSAVLNRAFGEMYNLRAIANILVSMPADDPKQPERAAPSFELPYSMDLPMLDRDAWRQHIDLLQASAKLIGQIHGTAGSAADAYLDSLLALDGQAIATFEAAVRGSRGPGLAYSVGGRA